MRKLVIISHTDHQRDPAHGIVGWGPTVNEINHLARRFDIIEHVACLENAAPRGGSLPYTDDRIRLRSIPPFGGKTLVEKLSIFRVFTRVMKAVREAMEGATHVQLRVPMGIGLFLIPYFMLRRRSAYIFWVKYANDWGQHKPPLGFGLQRWMLQRNLANCKVTVNGFWKGQKSHCISFENPCLQEEEIGYGRRIIGKKRFEKPYTLAFAGRLDDAKGVTRIIDALREIDPSSIEKVHFMGDGKNLESYRAMAGFLGEKVLFHGFTKNTVVRDILTSSHFFLLPTTASEGFPKAVAEAACYGAIPIVSNVGSIPHYVKDMENGFIWDPSRSGFMLTLERAFATDSRTLLAMSERGNEMSSLFTFERFAKRLESEIFEA